MATIQVRVDDSVKSAADSLFSNLGLDTSTAVRMFISASLDYKGIPFEIKRKRFAPRPVYGSGKGKMWIANDFDEPLDELKEYME